MAGAGRLGSGKKKNEALSHLQFFTSEVSMPVLWPEPSGVPDKNTFGVLPWGASRSSTVGLFTVSFVAMDVVSCSLGTLCTGFPSLVMPRFPLCLPVTHSHPRPECPTGWRSNLSRLLILHLRLAQPALHSCVSFWPGEVTAQPWAQRAWTPPLSTDLPYSDDTDSELQPL